MKRFEKQKNTLSIFVHLNHTLKNQTLFCTVVTTLKFIYYERTLRNMNEEKHIPKNLAKIRVIIHQTSNMFISEFLFSTFRYFSACSFTDCIFWIKKMSLMRIDFSIFSFLQRLEQFENHS